MTRIRTKQGDKGMTSLIGSKRISKASKKIAFLGELDEFNAFLGLAKLKIKNKKTFKIVETIQKQIIDLSATFAANIDITRTEVEMIEDLIEDFSSVTIKEQFTIPGVNDASALLNIARTKVRKAERTLIAIKDGKVHPNIQMYINALSDLMYLLGIKLGDTK